MKNYFFFPLTVSSISITLSSKVFCLPSILSSTSLCNSSIFSIIIFLVSSLNPNLSNKSK